MTDIARGRMTGHVSDPPPPAPLPLPPSPSPSPGLARRLTVAAIAVIPWALVLIVFGLLLCMRRHARLRRAAAAAAQQDFVPELSGRVAVRRAIVSLPPPGGPGTSNGASTAELVP